MDEKGLLALKQDIDKAKQPVAELKGKQQYLEEELKKNYGCSNIEEAEKLLGEMRAEATAMESDIKKRTQAIEERLAA
jgi:SMC interacting uncharacterized protein involved in chromosome segregation